MGTALVVVPLLAGRQGGVVSAMIPPLFEHQERCVQAGLLMPRLWFNVCYGGGKSRIALELIKRKRAKALVIAPLTLIETSWREDHLKFGYNFPFVSLRACKTVKKMEKWEAFTREKGPILGIMNPEAFITYERVLPMMRGGFAGPMGDYPGQPIDTLIIDEASRLKGRTTKIAKAVYALSKRVKSVYLLSGNLAPNGPHELWSPIRCLDEALLGSWWSFQGRYFRRGGYEQHQLFPIKEAMPELMGKIARVSVRVGKEDAPELPPQMFVTREVELGDKERELYERLKCDWIIRHQGETIVAPNVLAELSRLRQLACGFVYGPGGDALAVGESKLQVLREVLDEIGPEQVVIFSVWQEEIRRIKEVLGEEAGCVYGEVSDAEKAETIRAFQEWKLRYLVCHPRSGGVGLNLQSASYAVYASLDYSLESWEQSVARIHRTGQSRPCTYTVLLARNTIDEKVYAALRRKAKVSEVLMSMLKQEEAA